MCMQCLCVYVHAWRYPVCVSTCICLHHKICLNCTELWLSNRLEWHKAQYLDQGSFLLLSFSLARVTLGAEVDRVIPHKHTISRQISRRNVRFHASAFSRQENREAERKPVTRNSQAQKRHKLWMGSARACVCVWERSFMVFGGLKSYRHEGSCSLNISKLYQEMLLIFNISTGRSE